MSVDTQYLQDLLARLEASSRGAEAASAVAAPPVDAPAVAVAPRPPAAAPAVQGSPVPHLAPPRSIPGEGFTPYAPESLAAARLTDNDVEPLLLKLLLHEGTVTGRRAADQLGLPFGLVEPILARLKNSHQVVHKGSAPLADYVYQLTAAGGEQARQYYAHSSYCGTAPVQLVDYAASVQSQKLSLHTPTRANLESVFADLICGEDIKHQVGQALHGGSGLFLYGSPGNGKTSIAERITRAFGHTIWIPRTLGIGGELVRLFDPCNHEEVTSDAGSGAALDRRWVRIRRPTIVVGGELTMDRLEIQRNPASGVCEAPLQLKSNCGTLVIDDFGRQRMSTADLLNRWIVPLDRHYDFLQLSSGKSIQVPFEQFLVFSTNLEPKELVDEAFLRRIPYKIEISSPSEDTFRELFRMYAGKHGFSYCETSVEHLLARHYRPLGRALRACQPRDLLHQVRNYCLFYGLPLAMSPEAFDAAARNYFAIMS